MAPGAPSICLYTVTGLGLALFVLFWHQVIVSCHGDSPISSEPQIETVPLSCIQRTRSQWVSGCPTTGCPAPSPFIFILLPLPVAAQRTIRVWVLCSLTQSFVVSTHVHLISRQQWFWWHGRIVDKTSSWLARTIVSPSARIVRSLTPDTTGHASHAAVVASRGACPTPDITVSREPVPISLSRCRLHCTNDVCPITPPITLLIC